MNTASRHYNSEKKKDCKHQETSERKNKEQWEVLAAAAEAQRKLCDRSQTTSLIPNQRYVDHSNTTFNKMQLTSLEVSNLKLYHRSTMGGPFPIKLQILLKMAEELSFQHIISWLPHGRAFIIQRPLSFEKEIMKEFFNPTKFSSFKRQLNLYDFKRITNGVDSGAYYHEMFLRSKPLLALKMVRRKIKGEIRVSEYIQEEPEFYAMPFMSPIFDCHSSVLRSTHTEYSDQGFLPSRIRRNKELFHPNEDHQQETSISRQILIGAPRGYLDTRRVAAGNHSTSSFANTQQSRTIMTPPYNDLVLSNQQLYHRPHYNSTLSPPSPHQCVVQNKTSNLLAQMKNQPSYQNGSISIDCPLLSLPISSQQHKQQYPNKIYVPNSYDYGFRQSLHMMKQPSVSGCSVPDLLVYPKEY